MTPRVSVITATFNRAEILRFAIESVQRSTIPDWEMIVVGDACTDDSAEVVARVADDRVRFVNLESNHGEQSVPNDVGVGLARADTIAYLNHDDLYFPDHLERSLARLDATGADLVFSMVAIARPRDLEALRGDEARFTLLGASPVEGFEPFVTAPASGWVLRRDLVRRLGGWRSGFQLHSSSSQDFLHRAWRAGRDQRSHAHLGVLALRSGERPNCYVEDMSAETAWYADRMAKDPTFRESVLTRVAANLGGRAARAKMRPRLPKRRQLVYALAVQCGLNPRHVNGYFKFGGRGGLYAWLGAVRGLADSNEDERAND